MSHAFQSILRFKYTNHRTEYRTLIDSYLDINDIKIENISKLEKCDFADIPDI